MMQHNSVYDLIYDDFDVWKQAKGYKTSGYFWDFLLLPFAPLIWLFNGGIGFGQADDNRLAKIWNKERWDYYGVPENKRRYI